MSYILMGLIWLIGYGPIYKTICFLLQIKRKLIKKGKINKKKIKLTNRFQRTSVPPRNGKKGP
jgi:hypothetical protein